MKKIITVIIAIISGQLLTAQTALIQSIDVGGESTTASIQAVYIIGEVAANEYSDTNLKVSEGFLNDVSVVGTLSIKKGDIFFEIHPYPNPTLGEVYIDYPAAITVNYLIVDGNGKKVSAQSHAGRTHQLDINNLPKGIYFIKAMRIGEFKIIKK